MENDQSRRDFLDFLGRSTILGMSTPFLISCEHLATKSSLQKGPFLKPSTEDRLVLAEGLNFDIVRSWKDPISSKGDLFGDYNDFTSFMLAKDSKDFGFLWVNHESVSPWALHNIVGSSLPSRNRDQVILEQYQVGGSILKLKKEKGQWIHDIKSPLNRRLHGQTKIPFSGGQSIMGSKVATGTLANCSGGQTPWGTFLTSEENYQNFYGDVTYFKKQRSYTPAKKIKWHNHFPFPPEHYGWVVEINPYTGKSEKLVALGRARHEGATVTTSRSGKAVVYMGEDRIDGYIFKFVSNGMHLQSGALYAADTKKGVWIELNIEKQPELQKHFKNQQEVLTYSHDAAQYLGATPMDRPEDIEIDPVSGAVIVALTYRPNSANKHGSLFKISESGDHSATRFTSQHWILGSEDTFSCPDNLAFDPGGNLWMTCDISESNLGTGVYKKHGNNALYVIPAKGNYAGQALQMASAPVDAELTGPWFTPDGETLFLSVQHPGSRGFKSGKPTSHWPKGNTSIALSSVVSIKGSMLKKIRAHKI